MIRLIATDLDGTLLTHEGRVHPLNRVALRRAQAQGIEVAIASGRCYAACRVIAEDAGLSNLHILSTNGAEITPVHGARQCVATLNPSRAAQIIALARAAGLPACVCGLGTLAATDASLHGSEPTLSARLMRHGMELIHGDDAVAHALAHPVLKLYIVHEPAQRTALLALRQKIACMADVAVTSSGTFNIEIMPLGVDKGTGVAQLCHTLGIPLSQCCAFGDNENDVPMLERVGIPVAMGNAHPAVQRFAGITAGLNTEGGVGETILRLLRK